MITNDQEDVPWDEFWADTEAKAQGEVLRSRESIWSRFCLPFMCLGFWHDKLRDDAEDDEIKQKEEFPRNGAASPTRDDRKATAADEDLPAAGLFPSKGGYSKLESLQDDREIPTVPSTPNKSFEDNDDDRFFTKLGETEKPLTRLEQAEEIRKTDSFIDVLLVRLLEEEERHELIGLMDEEDNIEAFLVEERKDVRPCDKQEEEEAAEETPRADSEVDFYYSLFAKSEDEQEVDETEKEALFQETQEAFDSQMDEVERAYQLIQELAEEEDRQADSRLFQLLSEESGHKEAKLQDEAVLEEAAKVMEETKLTLSTLEETYHLEDDANPLANTKDQQQQKTVLDAERSDEASSIRSSEFATATADAIVKVELEDATEKIEKKDPAEESVAAEAEGKVKEKSETNQAAEAESITELDVT